MPGLCCLQITDSNANLPFPITAILNGTLVKLLVIIPCLNEDQSVAEVIRQIPREIPGIISIEVLVIDDGSTDNSAAAARSAGATVISHGYRRGVGAAFQTGLTYALENRFSIIANIDADGQFDPHQIPDVIGPILNGRADFVTGSRFLSQPGKIENMSFVKRHGNRAMNQLISRLSRRRFSDVSCGFRAYSREAALRLNLGGQFTYTQETFLDLAFQGVRIEEVPINVRYFADRQSRVAGSIVSYAIKTSKIILRTYRDYQPLRFFGALALTFFAPGMLIFGFFVGWYFWHGSFSPHIWAGFAGAALMFLGITIGGLGIVADMFTRVRRNQQTILYLLRKGST
jgi:glycosyltransferase involved in cell wall biosynthesis